jgi:hypothetical protein
VVAALLNGLPSDYDVMRTIVENTTPLPALDVVLPKLVIEEAKLMAVMPADRAKAYGVFNNNGNMRGPAGTTVALARVATPASTAPTGASGPSAPAAPAPTATPTHPATVPRPAPSGAAIASARATSSGIAQAHGGRRSLPERYSRLNYNPKGIEAQTTMAYNPEQNGKAERLNRTLINKAIPMLVASGLPQEAWAEAITTANHLRNISPTTNHNKTPYEAFFKCKPDVSYLRAFGATAYVHIPRSGARASSPHSPSKASWSATRSTARATGSSCPTTLSWNRATCPSMSRG